MSANSAKANCRRELWSRLSALMTIAAFAVSCGADANHSLPRASTKSERVALYYVDPMHPNYKSDKPGIAPDCGMKLEPVFAETADTAPVTADQPPGATVRIDDATQRLVGIRLATAEMAAATRVVRVVGRVVPVDTRIYRVNSGVAGFIRDTNLDSVGTLVRKNQKLAVYYAPDFIAAASGFLAANERVTGAVSKEGARSIQNYTDRLRNLGMSDAQIQRMADSKQLPESVDVVAPADGFILARNVSPGQHFEHDTEFYRIADLSRIWVVAEVYERDAPYLRPGGTALVGVKGGGRQLTARISDSLPQSEPGGGTIKIRLEVDNPAFTLRPEMLVDVELPVRLRNAVTVPLDALVDSGARSLVYVEREEGSFEPREVRTGWRSAERVEIVEGVKPGERVVASATFLVDSESRLKTPRSTPARKAPVSTSTGTTADPGKPAEPIRRSAGAVVKRQGDDDD